MERMEWMEWMERRRVDREGEVDRKRRVARERDEEEERSDVGGRGERMADRIQSGETTKKTMALQNVNQPNGQIENDGR